METPKEELTSAWHLNPVYTVPLASPTAVIIRNKLHDRPQLLSPRTVHVQSGLTQKAVILNTWSMGLDVLAVQ
jgi:hypothetical protein